MERDGRVTGSRRVWKVRFVKNYVEAHNHILIGEVLDENDRWVRIKGRTFHYGKAVNRTSDVGAGQEMVRIIPWGSIEVIHELPESFDWSGSKLVTDEKGGIVLADAANRTAIRASQDKGY